MKNLKLLIVCDSFMNETALELGHIILSARSSYEQDGTFMNSERRVQQVRKCIALVGDRKPDWAILGEHATSMGFGKNFAFPSPEQMWSEVHSVWMAGTGISYARIEHPELQWPCLNENHPRMTMLHQKSFPSGELFATSNDPSIFTNRVTSSHQDRVRGRRNTR